MSIKLNAVEVKKLKESFGEAFYLLDSNQFKINFLELKKAFCDIYSNFNIAYSYKTNYTPKLCKIVNELGGYAEVVSEMEMELALCIGVNPEKIIWNGPIKNSEKMEEFLLIGGVINIDSIEEMETIKTVVSKYPEKVFKLGIRCNYDVNDDVISRFGFDVAGEDFKKVLSFVSAEENVKFVNLQCHFAKRQIEYWPARVKGMLDIIESIGVVPERIDLGGALYGKMADSLKCQFSTKIPSYVDYAQVVAPIFKQKFGSKGPELIIEPGSALVGDCMAFIGTVKTIKKVRGKYFATVLGSQKNINMAGVNPPVDIISCGLEQKYYENIDLVGFTCIEGDVLYKNYCGHLAIGDMMVFGNCGSYSLVMKPPFILPNFPVLDLSNGTVEVVKRAEVFDDVFRTFNY